MKALLDQAFGKIKGFVLSKYTQRRIAPQPPRTLVRTHPRRSACELNQPSEIDHVNRRSQGTAAVRIRGRGHLAAVEEEAGEAVEMDVLVMLAVLSQVTHLLAMRYDCGVSIA